MKSKNLVTVGLSLIALSISGCGNMSQVSNTAPQANLHNSPEEQNIEVKTLTSETKGFSTQLRKSPVLSQVSDTPKPIPTEKLKTKPTNHKNTNAQETLKQFELKLNVTSFSSGNILLRADISPQPKEPITLQFYAQNILIKKMNRSPYVYSWFAGNQSDLEVDLKAKIFNLKGEVLSESQTYKVKIAKGNQSGGGGSSSGGGGNPSPTTQPTPPLPSPSGTPMSSPTPISTPTPTPVPSSPPMPTAQPTPIPTPVPTVQPTPVPTPIPTAQPTPVPTPTPLPEPTASPAILTQNQAQIALGAKLFFEPLLSGNNQMSCATCHDPGKGFSNDLSVATGITGIQGNRNTPTIYETHAQTLTFWDGRAGSLEVQALGPIENPIEMNDTLSNVIAELSAEPVYVRAFNEAYGRAPNSNDLASAIADFERTIRVTNTPDSRFIAGDTGALSVSQQRGRALFFSNRTNCSTCHQGASFSDQRFHSVGVNPNIDLGRFNATGNNRDRNRFKTPTLINIAQTGPYMHDGSLTTLSDVVAHYNQGGTPGSPGQPGIVRPLGLNAQEQADLVSYLGALTGQDNLNDIQSLIAFLK